MRKTTVHPKDEDGGEAEDEGSQRSSFLKIGSSTNVLQHMQGNIVQNAKKGLQFGSQISHGVIDRGTTLVQKGGKAIVDKDALKKAAQLANNIRNEALVGMKENVLGQQNFTVSEEIKAISNVVIRRSNTTKGNTQRKVAAAIHVRL